MAVPLFVLETFESRSSGVQGPAVCRVATDQTVDLHDDTAKIGEIDNCASYFYGPAGTGRTFLFVAAAGELLKTAHPVLYFCAAGRFEAIFSYAYGRKPGEEYAAFPDDLYSADLLLIDDPGTEDVNGFVRARLFECIGNRRIGRRRTIISSDLFLSKPGEQCSDRIFSRACSSYTLLKRTGWNLPDAALEGTEDALKNAAAGQGRRICIGTARRSCRGREYSSPGSSSFCFLKGSAFAVLRGSQAASSECSGHGIQEFPDVRKRCTCRDAVLWHL